MHTDIHIHMYSHTHTHTRIILFWLVSNLNLSVILKQLKYFGGNFILIKIKYL